MDKQLYDAADRGDVANVDLALGVGANVNYAHSNSWTPLLNACYRGHTTVVERLLAAGADVNLTKKDGYTPLICAAAYGHIVVVERLIGAGANVDLVSMNGNSALHKAAELNNEDIARLLIEAHSRIDLRNKNNHTAMDIFESKNNIAAVKILRDLELFFTDIKNGNMDAIRRLGEERRLTYRGIYGATPLHMAARHNHTQLVQLFVGRGARLSAQDENGCTPLHLACAVGDVTSVTIMGKGADLAIADRHGLTPLGVAARFGHLDVMATLVGLGANPTNVSCDGCSILHLVVLCQDASLVDQVVRSNYVDVNAVDKCGFTPLHYAVQTSKLSATLPTIYYTMPKSSPDQATAVKKQLAVLDQLLLANAVNPNSQNHKGETPLMVALSSDQYQRGIAEKLITSGVDVNIPNDKGQTALFVASERCNDALIRLLLNYGARTDVADVSGRTPISIAASADIGLIQVYYNSQLYHERCFALLTNLSSLPTAQQLQEIVPLITSVYDLRFILTLEALCEADMATKRIVLKGAFNHIVENRLVFDKDARMFFKLLLKHCHRVQLLSQEAFELLEDKLEIGEGSPCVMELKKQVHLKSWRLNAHEQHQESLAGGVMQLWEIIMTNQEALVNVVERIETLQAQICECRQLVDRHLKQDQLKSQLLNDLEDRLTRSEENVITVAALLSDSKSCYKQASDIKNDHDESDMWQKRVCGAVASVTVFVLAPTIAAISHEIVDVMNPIPIVTGCGIQDMTVFLLEKDGKRLPKVIQSELEKYKIPSDAFEGLLREAIALTHPEIIDECAQRGLSIAMLGGSPALIRSIEPLLDAETIMMSAIRHDLQVVMKNLDLPMEKIATPSCSQFPLHYRYVDGESEIQLVLTQDHACSHERGVGGQAAPISVIPLAQPLQTNNIDLNEEKRPIHHTHASLTVNATNPTLNTPLTVAFVSDPNLFPYHGAIAKCGGNVLVFQELVKKMDNSIDSHALMEMHVQETQSSSQMVCAAQYAYFRGYHDIGDAISARMTNPPIYDKYLAQRVEFKGNIHEFPYVMLVDENEGNVEEFEYCMIAFETVSQSIEDQIEAIVVREYSYEVKWTAYEYAAHMGYVDIVSHLFSNVCTDVLPKKRIQVIRQAVKQAKALQYTPRVSPQPRLKCQRRPDDPVTCQENTRRPRSSATQVAGQARSG